MIVTNCRLKLFQTCDIKRSRADATFDCLSTDLLQVVDFCAFTFKGKWQQKFLLSHLKDTLKVIYKHLLQNF